jgi:hypothetical protein
MAARDRDRDGVVDDLGPSSLPLLGNWGRAADAEEEDVVSAELGVLPTEKATAQ